MNKPGYMVWEETDGWYWSYLNDSDGEGPFDTCLQALYACCSDLEADEKE